MSNIIFANNLEIDVTIQQEWLDIVNVARNDAYYYLSSFRNDTGYTEKLQTAFGNNFDSEVANQLFDGFSQGNFSTIPTIEIVNRNDLNGANGAFAIATGKIYLAADFISQNAQNLDAIVAVLLEETGHSIDAKINVADAAGDEGDIFARLVQGKSISQQQLAVLKAEDDTTTVTLDGQVVQIEMNWQYTNQAWYGDSNDDDFGVNNFNKMNIFDTVKKSFGPVHGLGGNDVIFGSGYLWFNNVGNDNLYGDSGDDKLWGLKGNDALYGGQGDDVLGEDSGDYEEAGNDALYGGSGNDNLYGGPDNDYLFGEEGNDYLDGGTGSDQLDGYSGDDQLFTGEISDTDSHYLTGGLGVDTFNVGLSRGSFNASYAASIAGHVDKIGKITLDVFKNFSTSAEKFIKDNAWLAKLSLGSTVISEIFGLIKDFTPKVTTGLWKQTVVIKDFTLLDTLVLPASLKDKLVLNLSSITQVNIATELNGSVALHQGYGQLQQANNQTTPYIFLLDEDSNGDRTEDLRRYVFKEYTDPTKPDVVLYKLVPVTVVVDKNEDIRGYSNDDVLFGWGGDDNINSGAGNDILDGGDGNDTLMGGADIDTLNGGTGDDALDGGTGDDTAVFTGYAVNYQISLLSNGDVQVKDSQGNDTLKDIERINFGGVTYKVFKGDGLDNTLTADVYSFSALMFSGAGNDNIYGGFGNDIIYGESGNDNISGSRGDDTIYGGSGNDIIDGWEDNDYIDGGDNDDTINGNIGNDTIYGGSGNDNIYGGNDYDIVVFTGASVNYQISLLSNGDVQVTDSQTSRDGTDILTDIEQINFNGGGIYQVFKGTDSNDTLRAGGYWALMFGSVGNDTYVVYQTADIITENANEGTDTIQSSVTFSLANQPNIENLTLTGIAAINGTGNAGNNIITSNAGNNTLNGGAGNDTLYGDDYDVAFNPSLQGSTEFTYSKAWTSFNAMPHQLADVNGDGRADIVGFTGYDVYVAIGQTNGTFAQSFKGYTPTASTNFFGGSFNSNPRQVADVNGDGCADIIGFGNHTLYVALGQANGTFGSAIVASTEFATSGYSFNQNPRQIGDVNGDGRADYVEFGNGGIYVALGKDNGTFSLSFPALSNISSTDNWTNFDQNPRLLADVNGDGRADIVAFGNNNVYVALAKSDNTGTFNSAISATTEFTYSKAWTSFNALPRQVADVTGDGRADIVGFDRGTVYVASGQANGTFSTQFQALSNISPTDNWNTFDQNPRQVADVNGDGTADIVAFGNNTVYVSVANTGKDTLTGGLGKDTLTGGAGADRFDYRNLADSLFNSCDVITDFNAKSGNDLFLVSTARSVFSNAGSVATLDIAGIAAKLTTANFGANFAAQFTFGSRTFVAINDATAGFNQATDAIIEVTGFTGTIGLSNFTTV
ncbi:FG-GAP-like repeat-containing protein [Nostoc sp. NZL]|uniref:FG-GAP-like repeat-containing protein n=1 Tax=Nostoc sp. NZL TaxID=2650612 RepID=UPI0018C564E3|nr:FG-GAP-like repeat-containing protein [Nostoc sp. NZL]MBG1244075.1 hypothetical protein [Nostoc sp. NZL]MBG1244931.1 hypothetical protein [Nostoc sp. NZL]